MTRSRHQRIVRRRRQPQHPCPDRSPEAFHLAESRHVGPTSRCHHANRTRKQIGLRRGHADFFGTGHRMTADKVRARPGHKLEVNFQGASLEHVVRRASREMALGFTAGFAMLASAVTAASGRVTNLVSILFGITGAVFAVALIVDLWFRKAGKHG